MESPPSAETVAETKTQNNTTIIMEAEVIEENDTDTLTTTTLEQQQELPTVEKFECICRICLCELNLENNLYFSLFDAVDERETIEEVIQLHTAINIQENDELPQYICDKCYEELLRILQFVRKCQTSDEVLRCILEESKGDDNGGPPEDYDEEGNNDDDNNEEEEEEVENKAEAQYLIKQQQQPKYEIVSQNYEEIIIKIENDSEDEILLAPDNETIQLELQEDVEFNSQEYVKAYKCSVCNRVLNTIASFEVHMQIHLMKPHMCEGCNKNFSYKRSYNHHISTCHEYKKTKAIEAKMEEIMEGKVPSGDDALQPTADGVETVVQFEGTTIMQSPPKKKAKLMKITNGKDSIYPCPDCDRCFYTSSNLYNHRIVHTEKTIECPDCEAKFHKKADLEIHSRCHTGVKPYTCKYCNKSFTQQGSLSLHMLIHTGERPHQCHLCPKAFKQNHHLAYHLQSHSGEKPYVCLICCKGFASKRNLQIHTRFHTGEKFFKCETCQKEFVDQHGLNKHIKYHQLRGNFSHK